MQAAPGRFWLGAPAPREVSLRHITTFNRLLGEGSSVLVYSAVFVVTILDVALRYFFNSPTVWGLELVIAIAGVHYLLAGPAAQATDAHVRIDAIYNILPKPVQRVMDVVSNLLALVFLAIVFWYGIEQAWPAIQTGETSGGGWDSHAPTIMKAAIPVGAGLMCLQSIVGVINSVRRFRDER